MTDITRYPTLGVDDNSVGTIAWISTTSIYSVNSTDAIAVFPTSVTGTTARAKLIKPGGSLSTYYCDVLVDPEQTYTFDNSGHPLWDEPLTVDDVNNSDFGFAIQGIRPAKLTHYLRATAYNNLLPAAALISNIQLLIYAAGTKGSYTQLNIDCVYCTITYTVASRISGIQSITGIGSITF